MCQTPDLAGTYKLVGGYVAWNLCGDVFFQISIEDIFFGISLEKKLFARFSYMDELTHCHPEPEEIFHMVKTIGQTGNVMVVRKSFMSSSIAYLGSKKDCPFSPITKWRFGRIYYITHE